MKILHIINSLEGGGAEKLIVDIVPFLVQNANDVDVLLLNGKKTSFYEELERQKLCRIFSLGNSYYNPLYIFKIIFYLSKYDIVHVHLFPSMYFVALAKMLSFNNTKFVFTEHSTSNKRLNKNILRPIERFIYSYYQKVICITPEVKEQLESKLNLDSVKLIIIENGVNIEKIKIANEVKRIEFGYAESDKLLIMVAAFREGKDQDTVIKTLKVLPDDYKLILVGDGNRRAKLEDLVEKLDLKSRVNFLGFRSDIYPLYKMSDIAILSSYWEGFGLAAVEAMASGTPMIASDVSGLNNVVRGGGILFKTENVEDLKKNILDLILSPELYNRISNAGIEKSKSYSLDKTIQKLLNLYDQINNQ
ncbi:Glycosyltransferase involved in cell wall bisynthesis [Chryseobacterium carnipullorum]|uniref:glycosyltransferase family 4 protein n=1 Tax=Chryseobacterium carnipullorum TaxID=1124835 RepID=UPI00092265BC|nr:glycosyltransferase family 4 protein [Chryseobacterium carnipullorum]SHN01736.1 Glycosyltransferase involved in cell wall bisynthesis [Chryseobacterium carnipullorum]